MTCYPNLDVGVSIGGIYRETILQLDLETEGGFQTLSLPQHLSNLQVQRPHQVTCETISK